MALRIQQLTDDSKFSQALLFEGLCCKDSQGHDGRESRFRLRSGDQSEQASDERDLSSDIPFFYPIHLFLAQHMHTLISLEHVPSRLKRKEAHSWLDQPFDKAVVLFGCDQRQAPLQKALRSLSIAGSTQEAFDGLSVGIHSSIKVHPHSSSISSKSR